MAGGMYVCTYAYMYVHIHTCTHIHTQRMPPWPAAACVSLSDALKVPSEGAGASEVRMLAWQPDALQLWRWKVTSRGGADVAGVSQLVRG